MNFSIFVSKICHKNLLTIIIWLREKMKKIRKKAFYYYL